MFNVNLKKKNLQVFRYFEMLEIELTSNNDVQ
jgi:hypothetical protein